MGNEPQPDADAWIEKVVKVAGALGLNRMRVRWKLLRWQESRRKARRWREQRIEHIRYQHKTCSECGAVQDKNEAICTGCGAKLIGRGIQVLQRIGLTMPRVVSMSTLLALGLLGVYVRVWIAAGGGIGSPPVALLHDFGGHSPWATAGEPWRLVTAMFLHAGLWHLGFNLIAIATIGPRIEALYGRLTMLMLFIITGTLANAGSEVMGLAGVGIGASGGVMGLIGAAAGYGQRLGTSGGRALRDDMLKWTAYTIVFGFWLGADNWAHAFGALLGAAFGYAVRPALWQRPRLVGLRALGKLVGVAGAVGGLAIIFTRTPAPLAEAPDALDDAADDTADLAPLVRVCRMYYSGDPAGAITAAKPLQGRDASAASVERMCDELYELREKCRTGSIPADADAREAQRALCEAGRATLAELPDRQSRPGRRASARSGRRSTPASSGER